MKFFRWLESQFTLKTLNKKIFFISKLIALSIIGIHFISILFVKDSKIGIVTVILFKRCQNWILLSIPICTLTTNLKAWEII